MPARTQDSPDLGPALGLIAGAMLLALALVPAARAAEPADGDLVEVTPLYGSDDPAKKAADKDEETLLEHAINNAHGEVGATIGTGGTRGAYGIVTMPLGEKGSVTIAASTMRGALAAYPACGIARPDFDATSPGLRPGGCVTPDGRILR